MWNLDTSGRISETPDRRRSHHECHNCEIADLANIAIGSEVSEQLPFLELLCYLAALNLRRPCVVQQFVVTCDVELSRSCGKGGATVNYGAVCIHSLAVKFRSCPSAS